MISVEAIDKRAIQWHYDLTTVFYRLLWGRHIHHGLWTGDESPDVAQRQLTETLAEKAGLTGLGLTEAGSPSGKQSVLDVGCGMGGSSIHLARHYGCQVTGVTLSPVQKWWAKGAALFNGVRSRTHFMRIDAEKAEFPPASFDVVWSIECTEHLFDKPAFFARAAEWLRPGGRLAICAWLTADDLSNVNDERQIQDVCRGMLCPSLGSRLDYQSWFEQAGLQTKQYDDWSNRVARTWKICQERANRWKMPGIAKLVDRDSIDFLDKFQTMIDAYASGALRYGCFIAEKPAAG